MSDQLFSDAWYRVASTRPRLRWGIVPSRQHYRGQIWYVLRDDSSENTLRLATSAYWVVEQLDGSRSISEIWTEALQQLGGSAPTQDEFVGLLSRLYSANLLSSDIRPDAQEVFDSLSEAARKRSVSRWMNPLSIRIPVFDPDPLLRATVDWVRPLFSAWTILLGATVVLSASLTAATHWDQLTSNLADRITSPSSIALMWALFPVLKGIHEFGHAYTSKILGASVHEMGIMLILFTPVPYVDASPSWSLASKYHRAAVAGAGIATEVMLASVALLIWSIAEPGTVRSLAYHAFFISGFSTLIFNGNPLMRFDGYYVLADLIEVPNLASRSTAFMRFLAERYLLRLHSATRPETAPGETGWLVGYATASFGYRAFVIAAIGLWIYQQYAVVGIILGILSGIGWIAAPVFKFVRFLIRDPRIDRERGRAWITVTVLLALIGSGALWLPAPYRTRIEGVVWLPETSAIRSSAPGFVESLTIRSGAGVAPGEIVAELKNPDVDAAWRQAEAGLREEQYRLRALGLVDRAEVEMQRERVKAGIERLDRMQEKRDRLFVRSRAEGRVVIARDGDLPGRFLQQGDLIGHVVDFESTLIRAVVDQHEVALLEGQTKRVEVRFAERIASRYEATIQRIVPAASDRLPSTALAIEGGGEIAIDPYAQRPDIALRGFFEVEIAVNLENTLVKPGGRVFVLLDHGTQPLWRQLYRTLRQTFLSIDHV